MSSSISTYVMLLNDLLEACVVQLRELCQVMDVGNDVAKILLEQIEVFLKGISFLGALLRLLVFLRARHSGVDLLVRCRYAANDLLTLDAHEAVDFVELLLELLNEVLLGLLVPGMVHAQRSLQFLIVDIVKQPVLVQRLLQLLTEPEQELC